MAHESEAFRSIPDLPARRADIEVRLPAQGVYASVLRTTAAAVAARADFTLEEIEDLRIAIGEAATLVLAEADPDVDLVCQLWLGPGVMDVRVCAEAVDEPPADTDSFGWQVLTTVAAKVRAGSRDGRFAVTFSVHSLLPVGAGEARD